MLGPVCLCQHSLSLREGEAQFSLLICHWAGLEFPFVGKDNNRFRGLGAPLPASPFLQLLPQRQTLRLRSLLSPQFAHPGPLIGSFLSGGQGGRDQPGGLLGAGELRKRGQDPPQPQPQMLCLRHRAQVLFPPPSLGAHPPQLPGS